jgi:hypothetical protein
MDHAHAGPAYHVARYGPARAHFAGEHDTRDDEGAEGDVKEGEHQGVAVGREVEVG